LEQVRTFHRFLLDENYRHFVWFSGGGFHVWVMLDEVLMPTSGSEVSAIKRAGRTLLSIWEKDLGLTCSDPAVPFDTSGMIRIPNSYNDKKGHWSIPLTSEEVFGHDIFEIMELATEPRGGYYEYGEHGVHLDIKKHATPFARDAPKLDIATAEMDGVKILPCLNAAACQEGNPDHMPRVYLAQYLLHRLRWFFPVKSQSVEERKVSVDRVSAFMASLGWVDHDERTTHRYVQGIAEKYDDHPTCATLYANGLCLGKCQFHDGTGLIPDAKEEVVVREQHLT
jgi:hypothetical protein